MSRVAWVDAKYMPHRSAAAHIEGCEHQFALGPLRVVRIEGDPPRSGVPGPLSRRLREHYPAHVAEAA